MLVGSLTTGRAKVAQAIGWRSSAGQRTHLGPVAAKAAVLLASTSSH